MGAASVATFPRYLMVEYGVPVGEASTVVACSQAVRGWGIYGTTVSHTKAACTQVGRHLAWLTGSRD